MSWACQKSRYRALPLIFQTYTLKLHFCGFCLFVCFHLSAPLTLERPQQIYSEVNDIMGQIVGHLAFTSPLIALPLGHKQQQIHALDFTNKVKKAHQDNYTTGYMKYIILTEMKINKIRFSSAF